MAITNCGSGIWLKSRRTRLAILKLTVPATIIRSACRGVARKAPAPKRSMSKREAPVAIISMAQQARPNVIGHMLDSRAQLIACSSDVVMTLSSNRPSNHPIATLDVGRRRSYESVAGADQHFVRRRGRRGWRQLRDRQLPFFRGRAPDPVQVAAAPQVSEP